MIELTDTHKNLRLKQDLATICRAALNKSREFDKPGLEPMNVANAMEQSSEILWDRQHALPLSRVLSEDDLILLLTPVVMPLSGVTLVPKDPFEPLGRSIAARHPMVRHVPYTKRGGITGTHAAFINRCKVVVFVISGPPGDGEPSQADLAEVAAAIGDKSPQIVVTCCDIRAYDLRAGKFDTIIQIDGFATSELEKAAMMLFEGANDLNSTRNDDLHATCEPCVWAVERWHATHDLPAVNALWQECLPERFHLPQYMLGSLLAREGRAMHFVVRDPEEGYLIGFCATYTTCVSSSSDDVVGFLATLLVTKTYRGRGVGQSLHDVALRELQKTRGVSCLQLGSAYPRLLCGVPSDVAFDGWFRRRGWDIRHDGLRAQPFEISDWLLSFEQLPTRNLSTAGLTFRACEPVDFDGVLALVDRDSRRKGNMGWYDQYAQLENALCSSDIILGFEGETMVSASLLYTPTSGAPVSENIPWAKVMGMDVGGLTCICIADDNPEMVNMRHSVLVRLLDTCVRILTKRGMRHLFLDGIKGSEEVFQSFGFRRWSKYTEYGRKI